MILVKTVLTITSNGIYRKIVSNIFSRENYKEFDPRSNDLFIDAQIMIQARRLGLKIGEVPTSFDVLYKAGGSFISSFTFLELIKNQIQFRLIEFWNDRR